LVTWYVVGTEVLCVTLKKLKELLVMDDVSMASEKSTDT
jgi:hypothetical protein